MYFPGVGGAVLTTISANNISHQWNIVDTATVSLGSHSIKFGIDYRRIASPLNPPDPLVEGLYETTQSVLSNQATALILERELASEPVFDQSAVFAQDEWRVTPSLSLSLGLRWDLAPPPHELHGNDAFTLVGSISEPSSLALAPRGTALWKTSWYNFAPRLGLAWQAHRISGWETVVRSGGGVFFDTNSGIATLGYTNGIGFSALNELFGAPLPVSSSQLNFSPSATDVPYTSAIIYAFPSHLQLPYTLQWNVSLQQALGNTQALTLSYVGSNGRRLSGEQELSLTALNPDFGTVIYFAGGLSSNYQALQLQFQRSVAKGLHALASYTWSHSLDFGSTSTSLPFIRGNSDFDIRSNLAAGLTWDISRFYRGRIPNVLLRGWGLDGRVTARTGFPVTLLGNLSLDPASGRYAYSGLNVVPGSPLYVGGSQYPGGRAINPAAFTLPNGANFGDAPRNVVRGFGETQINFAARRDFHVTELMKLQFRAEAFNILNHPNFGLIDAVYTDAMFGQATQMLNASLATMASQYQQGGSRSMQFALKLIF
jgi:hypothetical protein